MSTPDILKKILDYKREEVAAAKLAHPLDELKSRITDQEEGPRGFVRSLLTANESGLAAIIAEVKKGSPSKGVIRADFDHLAIASVYAENGAACLSVLTDEHFFLGRLAYLREIRKIVEIPLLRKDFIFDPYQVQEARAAGADAILLIAAMLDDSKLREFAEMARDLGMDVLLEVHDEMELERAVATGCRLIGINNRSLRTFVTDLATTERLAPLVPADRVVVAESGINSRNDVIRLGRAGAKAFLIGESLMRERDMGAKMRELLGNS